MDLKTPLWKNISEAYSNRLKLLDLYTIEDLLYHIPARYEDYSVISKIADIKEGKVLTVKGTVIKIENHYTKNYIKIQQAAIEDETGAIDIIWFNQPFLTRVIKKGDRIALSGKTEKQFAKFIMKSPEYEILDDSPLIHTGRLVPVYPQVKNVSSKWLRKQIYQLLKDLQENKQDYLPDSIRQKYGFPDLFSALMQIHFPKTYEEAQKAKTRLSFDELFITLLKTQSARNKLSKQKVKEKLKIKKFKKNISNLIKSFPFVLTGDQKNAAEIILEDLEKENPMNRLLQGDVGSGKTVVASIALYTAFLNNLSSLLMAPTEILANQHYATITKLLKPFGVKTGLLTSSAKKEVLESHVVIGTHALLNKKFHKKDVGLIVIDEQHRFGVEQRAALREKGLNTHVLTMTATPIPRSIALTLYGDLDLTLIEKLPLERKPVKTWLVPAEKRKNAYQWIQKQITNAKTQAFIICPFIEESENMKSVKAAVEEYDVLAKQVFPKLKLGLLHGRMKPEQKGQVLEDFRKGTIDILIATPIVEVGIDIPNATIILIEAAERFGLSQLHQLRGRVGRGDKQSYCLLFTQADNQKTTARLKAMETVHAGSKLAEIDLKLRGAGDLYGTLQHGRKTFRIASLSDTALIQQAKFEAKAIISSIQSYPELLLKIQESDPKNISPD